MKSDLPPAPTLRHTTGRRPRDVALVLLAAALVAAFAAIAAETGITRFERDLFLLLHRLPAWMGLVMLPALQLGSLFAVGVAAGAALYLRRARLGTALAAGGTLAWAASSAVARFVSRGQAADLIAAVGLRGPADPGFPESHVAVVTALVTTLAPYLGRRLRQASGWLVAFVAASALFAGTALPLGVLVGAVIGWWAGRTVNLAVGAPGRRVTPDLVRHVLVGSGIEVTAIRLVRGRLWGTAEFAVDTPQRRLVARVLRGGARRASVADQVRRYLVALELHDDPSLASPKHRVEHEAYVSLLAERAGVRVPAVALARELPGGAAVIVTEHVDTTPLRDVEGDVDDELLREVWRQVQLLHRARVAHRGLWPDAVAVDDRGRPWIVGVVHARAAAGREQLLADVAELLVGLAMQVGADRAVRAAAAVLDGEVLGEALRYLHPLALPRRLRSALRRHPELLPATRAEVVEVTGVEAPETRLRINASTVLGVVVLAGAVYVLLPQLGSFEQLLGAVRGASWSWLAAVVFFGLLTHPAAAVSYWGAAPRPLPLGRATAVQLASAFAGRLTPAGVGGIGLNMIFMERAGLTRKETVAAAALNWAGGAVVHAALFVAAVGVLGVGVLRRGIDVPTGWPVLAAVLGILVLAGAALASPAGRRRVIRPAAETARTLLTTLRQPLRATALFGGSAAVTLTNAVAFLAAVAAFGVTDASPLVLMAVYIGGTAIAAAAPTPGGLGAVEAALVAALAGIGAESERAVAAVLSFRLLTFWLPILPGMVTYRALQHRGVV